MTSTNATDTAEKLLPGVLVLLVGPSGVGKNTLINVLTEAFPQFRRLPTATTRPQREGEVEGRDHFFVSLEQFQTMLEQGDLLEYQEVYPGKFYGAVRSYTLRMLAEGAVLIADVDVRGALALKAALGSQLVAVFIQPPSLEALAERLANREPIAEKEFAERLERARYELSLRTQFDYLVTNDQMEAAAAEICHIIGAELARRELR